jgi:hypothetical protein
MTPRRLALILCLIGLLLAGLLLVDATPFLRGGYGWQWPYLLAPAGKIVLLAGAVAVYGLGLGTLARRAARDRWWLAWSVSASAALALAVLALRTDNVPYELFARTVSPLATGAYTAAARIDWAGGDWRDWPALMTAFEGEIAHVSLAPPGLPMLYGLIQQALAALPDVVRSIQAGLLPYQCHNYTLLADAPYEWASAVAGILLPLWAALGALPLYAAARRMSGREVARLAVALFPLMPALLVFSGTWNSLYPLIGALTLWALLRGLDAGGGRHWSFTGAGWFTLAGVITGLAIFVNFAFIPLILLAGWLVLLTYGLVERRRLNAAPWLAPVLRGAWFALGLTLPWLLYGLASGQTLFGLLATSLAMHLELDRPYLPWVWLHFWDWVLWAGLPLALLWLAGLTAGWRRTGRPPVLALTLALTIALLIVSNFARGETGRVWILFAPMLLIAAADGLVRLNGRWRLLLVAQAGWMLAVAATLDAVHTGLTPPPAAPAAQAYDQPSGAEFDGRFRLDGWTAQADRAGIDLALTWTPLVRTERPYWFSALAVDAAGAPVGPALDWQPFATRYPTTCWEPGAALTDHVRLPLPPDAQGPFWISLSAFGDDAGQQRLPVTGPDGTIDMQIGLGPVEQAGR